MGDETGDETLRTSAWEASEKEMCRASDIILSRIWKVDCVTNTKVIWVLNYHSLTDVVLSFGQKAQYGGTKKSGISAFFH